MTKWSPPTRREMIDAYRADHPDATDDEIERYATLIDIEYDIAGLDDDFDPRSVTNILRKMLELLQ